MTRHEPHWWRHERQRHEDDPVRLDQAILGAAPALTALEVTESAGVTVEEARRLWRALGFPEMPVEAAFTDADIDAIRAVMGIVETGAVEFDTVVNLTRAVGRTMARLADWEVATLASRVEELEAGDEATGSRTRSALRLLREVNPPFEQMLVYAWRRHLAAAVTRVEALGDRAENLHTTDVTVGFADLVGFTRLSNEMDRDQIGDLVELFESRCHDVISTYGGRIIKSLGDSVLFVVDGAAQGVEIAEGIIHVVGRDTRMPDVRVGLASGAVIMRLGDVFGPPVNLAARLTHVARRNRLILDQATADLLPTDVFEARRLPPRPVHGFGLVEPVAVRRR